MERTRRKKNAAKPQPQPQPLKAWYQISEFLGQPISVAQRWGKDGMPVKREGRFVVATPDELNQWLGHEAGGEPVNVATHEADLSEELKRGLAFIRKEKAGGNRT